MTQKQLEQASFKFIENNLDSTFDAIPDFLLDLWTLDDGNGIIDDAGDKCDEFTFFLYAFLLYKKRQGLKSFAQDQDELDRLFDVFQMILGMAIISRNTDIKVKPIKMFDFDNYFLIQVEFC